MNKHLILVGIALLTRDLTAQTKVLFEKESKYHYIRVNEHKNEYAADIGHDETPQEQKTGSIYMVPVTDSKDHSLGIFLRMFAGA